MNRIYEQICELVFDVESRVWRRDEFLTMGSTVCVDDALCALVREGRFLQIEDGMYVPLRDGDLATDECDYQLRPSEVEFMPAQLQRSWAMIVRRYGGVMKILSQL